MLSRFSDVLQSAADVLAPPATRLEDFEYHWKQVVNFYQNYDESSKVQIEDTRIPHHLHQMLQLIVDEENEQQGGTVGPCLEAIIKRSIGLLDALALLVAADRPPGARASALTLATSLLRRTKSPCLNSPHVYRPLQRMLVICNESPASPTEKEEVELLLTLCGLVRKEPGLANIFTTPFVEDTNSLLTIPEDIQTLIPIKSKAQTPKKNPLFEVDMVPNPLKTVAIVRVNKDENCIQTGSSVDDNASSKSHKTVYDDNDKFLLIDLLLSYLESADNQVVLRACEGILIVSSLAEDDIAALLTGASPACERLAARLLGLYRALPPDIDPIAVDTLSTTWAYVAQDFGDKNYNNFYGYRELTAFFSWLDYIDTLMKECHPLIAAHLSRAFRTQFLEAAADSLHSPASALRATAVLAKCLRALDSQHLVHEFSEWLVGEGGEGGEAEWSQLHALAARCLEHDHDLTLETLRFFEAVIEKGTEHSIDRLVLSRVSSRAYRLPSDVPQDTLQDERDRLNDMSHERERERARESHTSDERAGGLLAHADDNIHRVVNSFLLLLPRGVQSQPLADCEHYVLDAQRHYQLWLDITATYNWPTELSADVGADSTHSYDSRPEADLHLDEAFGTIYDYRKSDKTPTFPNCPKDHNTGKSEKCPFSQTLVLRNGDAPAGSEEDFDEGPFLRMIFKLLSSMPDQPYQVNLHLTSIISKLALLPHPYLHEYLLNPDLPTSRNTPTLFKTLQELARRLTMEVPRIKNYKKVIETTRQQLMSEDPSYDEIGCHNQLVESLIVLEEFCKELAAIAFVKHQHQLQMSR